MFFLSHLLIDDTKPVSAAQSYSMDNRLISSIVTRIFLMEVHLHIQCVGLSRIVALSFTATVTMLFPLAILM